VSDSPFRSLQMNHFSVAVRDLDEALQWYRDLFGMALERRTRFDAADLQGENAFIYRDGIRLELWALDDVASLPVERREPNSDLLTCGTKHIAFEVSGLQAVLDELVVRGIDIATVQRIPGQPHVHEEHPEAAYDPGRKPAYASFIRDPQGTLIELLDPAQRLKN
jgi:catechol 2,3-dioxygenase-like lactoylglutathione lyase family enzyme